MAKDANSASKHGIIALLDAAVKAGIDVIKTENLYAFDGKAAYSLGQGQ
jgi:isocitrate dehydrogenase